jgi:hypothetical protein
MRHTYLTADQQPPQHADYVMIAIIAVGHATVTARSGASFRSVSYLEKDHASALGKAMAIGGDWARSLGLEELYIKRDSSLPADA